MSLINRVFASLSLLVSLHMAKLNINATVYKAWQTLGYPKGKELYGELCESVHYKLT